jgi:hypothetical protein
VLHHGIGRLLPRIPVVFKGEGGGEELTE